jgi:hypothetical protein
MESPKWKLISDVNAGVLMIDQVKTAILERTAVRFDLPKGKRVKFEGFWRATLSSKVLTNSVASIGGT